MRTEYSLYINDKYFGTYSTLRAARKVAQSQSCQYEICRQFPNQLQGILTIVAKGWNR